MKIAIAVACVSIAMSALCLALAMLRGHDATTWRYRRW